MQIMIKQKNKSGIISVASEIATETWAITTRSRSRNPGVAGGVDMDWISYSTAQTLGDPSGASVQNFQSLVSRSHVAKPSGASSVGKIRWISRLVSVPLARASL